MYNIATEIYLFPKIGYIETGRQRDHKSMPAKGLVKSKVTKFTVTGMHQQEMNHLPHYQYTC